MMSGARSSTALHMMSRYVVGWRSFQAISLSLDCFRPKGPLLTDGIAIYIPERDLGIDLPSSSTTVRSLWMMYRQKNKEQSAGIRFSSSSEGFLKGADSLFNDLSPCNRIGRWRRHMLVSDFFFQLQNKSGQLLLTHTKQLLRYYSSCRHQASSSAVEHANRVQHKLTCAHRSTLEFRTQYSLSLARIIPSDSRSSTPVFLPLTLILLIIYSIYYVGRIRHA